MSDEYPSAAFVITIVGAVFALFGWGILTLVGLAFVASSESAWEGSVCIIIGLIGSSLGFLAAYYMKKPEKVHTGGILAIIAAFITVWSIIPFILMLIGGMLALTWKKPEEKAVILPPPPPS